MYRRFRDVVPWHEAYTICSVARDLKINETVDLPNWLVSMTLPRGIFA